MAGQQTRVVCPVCGMSRMNSSFERSDEKGFGNWDEDSPIIQIRSQVGGKPSKEWVGSGHYRKSKGPGFPIIGSSNLEEAKEMPEYSEYIEQISNQLIKVFTIFYRQGLITDEDIDSIR